MTAQERIQLIATKVRSFQLKVDSYELRRTVPEPVRAALEKALEEINEILTGVET